MPAFFEPLGKAPRWRWNGIESVHPRLGSLASAAPSRRDSFSLHEAVDDRKPPTFFSRQLAAEKSRPQPGPARPGFYHGRLGDRPSISWAQFFCAGWNCGREIYSFGKGRPRAVGVGQDVQTAPGSCEKIGTVTSAGKTLSDSQGLGRCAADCPSIFSQLPGGGCSRLGEAFSTPSNRIAFPLSPAEGVHLQNVVRQANQRPFAAHLLQPAEEKPSHSAPLFDLAKHRLGDPLALGVKLRPGPGLQVAFHPLHPRRCPRQGPALRPDSNPRPPHGVASPAPPCALAPRAPPRRILPSRSADRAIRSAHAPANANRPASSGSCRGRDGHAAAENPPASAATACRGSSCLPGLGSSPASPPG